MPVATCCLCILPSARDEAARLQAVQDSVDRPSGGEETSVVGAPNVLRYVVCMELLFAAGEPSDTGAQYFPLKRKKFVTFPVHCIIKPQILPISKVKPHPIAPIVSVTGLGGCENLGHCQRFIRDPRDWH